MRALWAWTVGLGLVIAAGSAGAAEAKREQAGGAQATVDRATDATKHFAVANAGLESAEANAEMLSAITRKQELYDRAHGELFVKNIRDAITYANGHIQHIKPLVQTDAERKNLQQLEERVARVESMLPRLDSNLDDVQALNREANSIDQAIDGAQEPLENLAEAMNVEVDVG